MYDSLGVVAIANDMRSEIDVVAADPFLSGDVLRLASVNGAYAGQQLGDVERFGDVVVSAGVECVYFVSATDPPREHHDRDRAPGSQPPDDFDTVDVWQ